VLAVGYTVMGLRQTLVMFYIGYCAARMAAQGALGASVIRTIPVNWFRVKRGRAMGLVMMAVPIGAASSAMIGQWALLQGYSWREVAFGMAVLTLLLAALPAALFVRKSPETMGLLPDGAIQSLAESSQSSDGLTGSSDEFEWNLRSALKTRSLQLLILASVLGITANGAVVFYHVTYLVSKGIPQLSAVTSVSVLALFGALANLVWGMLSERYSERKLAICSQVGAAVLIQGMLWVDTFTGALLLAMALGIVVRGESSLTSLLVASYFGRAAYGRIAGFMTSFQLFGLGAGPLIASMIYDLSHSFTLVYGVVGVTYALAAVTFFFAKPPTRPVSA
ncbi:MAG: MFS transporter, partial [Immundisolibacteraceae bacterium]|nr:MFS transporter [Immundisolibacteraceae bacterium]